MKLLSEIPAERPPSKTRSTDYDDVLAHDLQHLIVEIETWIGEAMKVPSDDESAFICTVRYPGVGVPVRGKAPFGRSSRMVIEGELRPSLAQSQSAERRRDDLTLGVPVLIFLGPLQMTR